MKNEYFFDDFAREKGKFAMNNLEILKSCEAFLEGHFLLSSGRHSSAYCQMAFLQQYPDKLSLIHIWSEQSARLSGVNVLKNRIAIYMCSGLFASVAGLMLASMSNSASPIAGADYSFDAIAAVVIGGTSFDGGKGGLGGTVLGVLLLRTLASGLNLLGVASTWQKAIIGLVIVSIIVAQVAGENVKKKNESRRLYADAE